MKTKYTVLITTSGLGSRLGDVTKYTNKSLITLGEKPIISYIIELYPVQTEFVITIGYMGAQVKDFLKLAYPKHRFSFITIDPYQGKGSSLGYTMIQASSKLSCPFIFHASDTIVTERPPAPVENWIGGFKGEGSSLYRSFNTIDNTVQKMNDKGAVNPDYLHIGLIGIHDHTLFWKHLKKIYKENPNDSTLSDVHVIQSMINNGTSFSITDFKNWYDTGNVAGLNQARSILKSTHTTLEKLEESIYFFDNTVIKYFHDEKIAQNRVKRAHLLKGLVPRILQSKNQFYMYKKVQGNVYSDTATPATFPHFLQWLKKNLWKKNQEVSPAHFKRICHDFYYTKSLKRIHSFLETRSVTDRTTMINGEEVPDIETLFSHIDFESLSSADQYQFHGDLILDNIIQTKNSFCLLDWRQDFGGLLKSGDRYYDLAKLNHNLMVNHQIVTDNNFMISMHDADVKCDILRKETLVECQKILFDFIEKEGLDVKRVKILTGLIWLNMSPLHHHPFDLFLFYFGKLYLWRSLYEKN